MLTWLCVNYDIPKLPYTSETCSPDSLWDATSAQNGIILVLRLSLMDGREVRNPRELSVVGVHA